jgi:hypothetical protein
MCVVLITEYGDECADGSRLHNTDNELPPGDVSCGDGVSFVGVVALCERLSLLLRCGY